MVRWIARLIGIGFCLALLFALVSNVSGYFRSPPDKTAEEEFHLKPRQLALASDGPLGKFDRQQLQRGFQVYKEVCSACHSMKLVAFRDLAALGYNEDEVKAIANQWQIQVAAVNPDTGEAITRKAVPTDYFPSPYPNETAARAANNNALPPDLSLMTKARKGGAAYVYSLLTGYRSQPAELVRQFAAAKTPPNLNYNPYFANLNIAMPPPLTSEGQVTYAPGNPRPTVDQMAKDVAAFLVWTAEPKLEARHRYGLVATIFLLFATLLGYLAYRNVWAKAKRTVRVAGPLEPANQAKSRAAKRKSGVAG